MMDLVQRANIFSSFDSLRGFKDLLRAQEKEEVQKRVISEDDIEELNRRIYILEKGMMVEIEYWQGTDILKIKGLVAKINICMSEIQIVKTRIQLKQIIWIEIPDESDL